MADKRLPDEFKEFLKFLNRHRVRYLLIGGWAVGIYSNPRVTADIDFLIGTDDLNLEKIVNVLSDFGLKGAHTRFFQIEGNTFRIGRPPIKIDILTKALGIDFESCYRRRKIEILDGIRIKVISKQDLLKSKLAANRPKDWGDIESLKSI